MHPTAVIVIEAIPAEMTPGSCGTSIRFRYRKFIHAGSVQVSKDENDQKLNGFPESLANLPMASVKENLIAGFRELASQNHPSWTTLASIQTEEDRGGTILRPLPLSPDPLGDSIRSGDDRLAFVGGCRPVDRGSPKPAIASARSIVIVAHS